MCFELVFFKKSLTMATHQALYPLAFTWHNNVTDTII